MSRRERVIPEFVFDNMDNIKGEALKQGYTLKALGEAIGFPRGFTHNLATGTFTPSMGSYNKIAAVLGWKEWR